MASMRKTGQEFTVMYALDFDGVTAKFHEDDDKVVFWTEKADPKSSARYVFGYLRLDTGEFVKELAWVTMATAAQKEAIENCCDMLRSIRRVISGRVEG